MSLDKINSGISLKEVDELIKKIELGKGIKMKSRAIGNHHFKSTFTGSELLDFLLSQERFKGLYAQAKSFAEYLLAASRICPLFYDEEFKVYGIYCLKEVVCLSESQVEAIRKLFSLNMSTAQIPGLLSGSEIVSCLTKYAKSIVVTTQDAINIGQELLNRGDIVAVTLNAQTFVESNKSLYRISERIELTENEQQNFCPWRIVNGAIRGTEECDISGYVHKRILQNSKEQKIRWAKLLTSKKELCFYYLASSPKIDEIVDLSEIAVELSTTRKNTIILDCLSKSYALKFQTISEVSRWWNILSKIKQCTSEEQEILQRIETLIKETEVQKQNKIPTTIPVRYFLETASNTEEQQLTPGGPPPQSQNQFTNVSSSFQQEQLRDLASEPFASQMAAYSQNDTLSLALQRPRRRRSHQMIFDNDLTAPRNQAQEHIEVEKDQTPILSPIPASTALNTTNDREMTKQIESLDNSFLSSSLTFRSMFENDQTKYNEQRYPFAGASPPAIQFSSELRLSSHTSLDAYGLQSDRTDNSCEYDSTDSSMSITTDRQILQSSSASIQQPTDEPLFYGSKLLFDKRTNRLWVGTTKGSIFVFDVQNHEENVVAKERETISEDLTLVKVLEPSSLSRKHLMPSSVVSMIAVNIAPSNDTSRPSLTRQNHLERLKHKLFHQFDSYQEKIATDHQQDKENHIREPGICTEEVEQEESVKEVPALTKQKTVSTSGLTKASVLSTLTYSEPYHTTSLKYEQKYRSEGSSDDMSTEMSHVKKRHPDCAVWVGDEAGNIYVWDAKKLCLVKRITSRPRKPVHLCCVKLTPDNKFYPQDIGENGGEVVFSSSANGLVKVWSPKQIRLLDCITTKLREDIVGIEQTTYVGLRQEKNMPSRLSGGLQTGQTTLVPTIIPSHIWVAGKTQISVINPSTMRSRELMLNDADDEPQWGKDANDLQTARIASISPVNGITTELYSNLNERCSIKTPFSKQEKRDALAKQLIHDYEQAPNYEFMLIGMEDGKISLWSLTRTKESQQQQQQQRLDELPPLSQQSFSSPLSLQQSLDETRMSHQAQRIRSCSVSERAKKALKEHKRYYECDDLSTYQKEHHKPNPPTRGTNASFSDVMICRIKHDGPSKTLLSLPGRPLDIAAASDNEQGILIWQIGKGIINPIETDSSVISLAKEDFFEPKAEMMSLERFCANESFFGRLFVLTEGNHVDVYDVCKKKQ